ncbi:hypothetical protein ACWEOZ_17645 [Actinoplanes sp. NPDC004185]
MPTDQVRTVAELSELLAGWLRRLMPPGPRLDGLTADLAATFTGRHEPVDAAGCRALQTCANVHSRHLELHFDPAGAEQADDEANGWPPPDPGPVRRRAAGVTSVRRLDDGTCVLTLDALEPYAIARPYLDAALTLARDSTRLVLDLRGNGGGDPGGGGRPAARRRRPPPVRRALPGPAPAVVDHRLPVRQCADPAVAGPDQPADVLLGGGAGLPPAGTGTRDRGG